MNILAVGSVFPDNIPDETASELAYNAGCREAFNENYTGHDSVSTCVRFEETGLNKFPIDVIVREYRW